MMKKILFALIALVAFCSGKAGAQLLAPAPVQEMPEIVELPKLEMWSTYNLMKDFSIFDFMEDNGVDEMDSNLPSVVDQLTEYASQFVGRRYRLGSTGPKTFDCSGFVSYVFRSIGVNLNRTSRQQYRQGESVERHELRPGDLMFFSSPRSGKGNVGHVAMVVSVEDDGKSCTFIHAATSKGVTYQKFPDGGYYSKNYIGAKRILNDEGSMVA